MGGRPPRSIEHPLLSDVKQPRHSVVEVETETAVTGHLPRWCPWSRVLYSGFGGRQHSGDWPASLPRSYFGRLRSCVRRRWRLGSARERQQEGTTLREKQSARDPDLGNARIFNGESPPTCSKAPSPSTASTSGPGHRGIRRGPYRCGNGARRGWPHRDSRTHRCPLPRLGAQPDRDA